MKTKYFMFKCYLHEEQLEKIKQKYCKKGVLMIDMSTNQYICNEKHFHKVLSDIQEMKQKVFELRAL